MSVWNSTEPSPSTRAVIAFIKLLGAFNAISRGSIEGGATMDIIGAVSGARSKADLKSAESGARLCRAELLIAEVSRDSDRGTDAQIEGGIPKDGGSIVRVGCQGHRIGKPPRPSTG